MSTVTIYDVHLFSDFFANVDAIIGDVWKNAASGLADYIVPIAWTSLCILGLIWAGAIWNGQGSSVKDWWTKLAKFVFILQFVSVFYVAWVATPLLTIPDEISLALAKGQTAGAITSSSPADQLTGALEQLVLGTMQAAVDAFKDWNIGGALTLFSACVLMIIAGVLLLISVAFNMLYAKIGMFYVLSIGPLFLFFLALGLRNWFTGWLNTAFYFVMLTVLSTLSMLLFTGIANKFMQKLTDAIIASQQAQIGVAESLYSMLGSAMSGQAAQGAANVGNAAGSAVAAQLNIVSIALQMVLIFIPMFLVALETRTLVGSLTGGSGGSFGSGVANVVSTAWRGGWGRHSGGGGGGGGGDGAK